MSEKQNIVEKLVEVYKAITHVAKRGENEAQNYKYMKATDIAHAVRNALADLGVYAEVNMTTERTYDVERQGKGPMHFADVRATINFYDKERVLAITSSGLGSGMDAGDKAIFKAQTGALKYALRNAFLVPDDADPENDAEEDAKEPATKATAPPKQTEKTATKATTKVAKEPATSTKVAVPKAEIPSELPGAATPAGEAKATPVANPAALNPVEDDAVPSEAQLPDVRKKFSALTKTLSEAGLESGKGKPVGRKVTLYLLHRTGTKDPDQVTFGQWKKFFDECETYRDSVGGFEALAKVVEATSGGK
jgi:ERF superfamily